MSNDIKLQCLACGNIYKDSKLQRVKGWCPNCKKNNIKTNKWKEVIENETCTSVLRK